MKDLKNTFRLKLDDKGIKAERISESYFDSEEELFRWYNTLVMKAEAMIEFLDNYEKYKLKALQNRNKQEKEQTVRMLELRKADYERDIMYYNEELKVYDDFIKKYFAEQYKEWFDKFKESLMKNDKDYKQ